MQLKWFEAVIDRIQPTLRSGCNYINLDRIRAQSEWNDYETKWILPKLAVEKVTLPSTNSGESFGVFPFALCSFCFLFSLIYVASWTWWCRESSSWHSGTMLSENVACCFRWQFSLRNCEINKFAVFCHLICDDQLWLCLDAFKVFHLPSCCEFLVHMTIYSDWNFHLLRINVLQMFKEFANSNIRQLWNSDYLKE